MSIKKSKYSVAAVINKKGNIVGYLSNRDEERGVDIAYDLKGYKIVALWQRKKEEISWKLEPNLSYIDRIHDLENFWKEEIFSTIAITG